MSASDWPGSSKAESKILFRSAMMAFCLELGILFLVGVQEHWLAHPQKANGADSSKYIEAEIFRIPQVAHLTEEKQISKSAPLHEAVLSKIPGKGIQGKPNDAKLAEENQIQRGVSRVAPNHGPIAVFTPAPVIPPYLRDQELNTTAVIDFFITALGSATPRLVGSTGNEELDAIALGAVKKWQFRPAEKDHQAIDSKVRLRIHFEVN